MEDYRAKYYSCSEIQKLLQKLYKKEVKLRTLRSWFQDVPIANQYDEKIRLYGIDIVETTLAEYYSYAVNKLDIIEEQKNHNKDKLQQIENKEKYINFELESYELDKLKNQCANIFKLKDDLEYIIRIGYFDINNFNLDDFKLIFDIKKILETKDM